ncbi:MAG: SDR family oxidoreductase [Myxococcales bacterium]|nr:SDR family oxidoreductase [Myxococcales bacterium]
MSSSSPIRTTDPLALRIQAATELLEECLHDRGLLAHVDTQTRERLLIAAGRLSRPDRHERKALAREQGKLDRSQKRDADEALLNQTGIRKLRENPIFLTPRRRAIHNGIVPQLADYAPEPSAATEPIAQGETTPDPRDETLHSPGEVSEERLCYCCRAPYTQIHHFYDQLCPTCGDFNFERRDPHADLHGRVALVTGARVKIGYHAVILLLRSGCRVIAATRFPHDAARRYAAEHDYEEWKDRLHIYGIDLRHTPSVEQFCQHLLGTLDRLDFIINNACQTVRRPAGFYDHLMDAELDPSSLSDAERVLVTPLRRAAELSGECAPDFQVTALSSERRVSSAMMSQLELLAEDRERGAHLFPEGALDADQQQVDLRTVNSWRLRLSEVPTVELLEVQLVNAVAPFILNARLKPLMLRVPTHDKHIVNVSAMEGQFYRVMKNDRHPHTNMAKAALNMLTRTAAMDYVRDGIHMNSVDTGWVTDEDPAEHARLKREIHRFHPPLDVVDGAARIVDPIFSGIHSGEHVWGQFLKDYRITDW